MRCYLSMPPPKKSNLPIIGNPENKLLKKGTQPNFSTTSCGRFEVSSPHFLTRFYEGGASRNSSNQKKYGSNRIKQLLIKKRTQVVVEKII